MSIDEEDILQHSDLSSMMQIVPTVLMLLVRDYMTTDLIIQRGFNWVLYSDKCRLMKLAKGHVYWRPFVFVVLKFRFYYNNASYNFFFGKWAELYQKRWEDNESEKQPVRIWIGWVQNLMKNCYGNIRCLQAILLDRWNVK